MSKSDPNPASYISILDKKDDIIKKFKRAVTDSGTEIRVSDEHPGISNLIHIYSAFSGKTVADTEKEFEGKGYGDFKLAVGEVCADKLGAIQANFNELIQNKDYLEKILAEGANAAERIGARTMSKVYRKVGFYPRPELK